MDKDMVVVVLGCRPDGDRPTPELVQRVREGLRVAALAQSRLIIYSGGRTAGGHSEAFLMQKIAEEEFPGYSVNAILECSSTDTISNAYYTARILEKIVYDRICIVTSPYHVKRSAYIFNRVLGREVETSTFGPEPETLPASEEEGMELARYILDGVETMNLDEIWRRMTTMHPYFLAGGQSR